MKNCRYLNCAVTSWKKSRVSSFCININCTILCIEYILILYVHQSKRAQCSNFILCDSISLLFFKQRPIEHSVLDAGSKLFQCYNRVSYMKCDNRHLNTRSCCACMMRSQAVVSNELEISNSDEQWKHRSINPVSQLLCANRKTRIWNKSQIRRADGERHGRGSRRLIS